MSFMSAPVPRCFPLPRCFCEQQPAPLCRPRRRSRPAVALSAMLCSTRTTGGAHMSSTATRCSGRPTVAPVPVTAGSNLTYTIRITNNGLDAAENVTVTDILPGATTFISSDATGGGVSSGAENNRAVTFSSLAPGASGAITLVVQVKCSVANGEIVSNTATISSATFDPEQSNNTATTATTVSNPPPIITLNPPITLWPPNHGYHTVTVAQMVQSVRDNCPISIDDVVIEVATSDEPDDDLGDGNTSDDIVIGADCRSVQLRAERAGTGDGRVYTVTLRVRDSGGAVTRADFEVSVPHSQNGDPAVKGPTALNKVMSVCR